MKQKSKDFFEAIKEYPHNIGIYLTYTLDLEVINKLTEVATGTILILNDFTKGISLDDNLGSSIICLPIRTLKTNHKNCFHSKLALLKSDNSAKLIVGSANLSKDSFWIEKEIALEIALKFENNNDVYVYNKVLDFLISLQNKTLTPNEIFPKTIERLKINNLPESEGDIRFIYNSNNKSIFDELKNYLAKHRKKQNAKSIKIVTPFVSEKYKEIEAFNNISANISVYLRNGSYIEPFREHNFIIYQPSSKKREGFHAKLILIEYANDSVLFIGSANFTEQGFFNNLYESANQECGILIKVKNDELSEWLNSKCWKQLSPEEIEIYESEKNNLNEVSEPENKFYAWAENHKSGINTFIYNPEGLPIKKELKQGKIKLQTVDKDFYLTTVIKAKNEKVTFYVGDEIVSIPVFEPEEYLLKANEGKESIFNSAKGINSTNPEELDRSIEKEGVSVSDSNGVKISEPPILEQYYYNVKNLLQNLNNKKYFSEFNKNEIKEEIYKSDDSRIIYLTLQLLKLFNSKPNTEDIKAICKKRIYELSDTINLNNKKMDKFLNIWLSSNN